ncbi:MAG: hypothetical protein CMJ18_21330, partial [Phycisphaeraceae bacterium]|nr:hypothetical protein [Phycisphaeraceae bacterium]
MVAAVAAEPVISDLDGDTLAYNRGSGPLVVEQGADVAVTDADSTDFDTGRLTVSLAAGGAPGEDFLAIRDEGNAPGEIGFNSGNGAVSLGGTQFGVASGGSSTSPLVINFDPDAAPAVVAALLRNVTFENTSLTPTEGVRTVRFVVDDGDGNVSAAHDASVFVADHIVVVTDTTDVADGDTTSIAHLMASNPNGTVSFREAILATNGTTNLGSTDEIRFAIPLNDPGHVYYRDDATGDSLSDVQITTLDDASIGDFDDDYLAAGFSWYTIQFGSPLDPTTDPVIIDGTTQPGFAANPIIEIDGTNVTTEDGLVIQGGDSTILGLVVNRFVNDDGIELETNGGNTIAGNHVGTDVTGTVALPNNVGLRVKHGDNVIGGATAADRNIISGNANEGVILRTVDSTDNVVIGNYIGVDASGFAPLGNARQGIEIRSSAANNRVGGRAAGEANVIAFNDREGVFVDSTALAGNTIVGNSIFSNTDLGIGIEGGTENIDGVTDNDAGDADTGANNLQNYPTITLASTDGTDVNINVTLNSVPSTADIVLDFYWSTVEDASTYGEGENYVGSISVTTDAGGNASPGVTFLGAGVPVGAEITATATHPDGSTSEFSQAVAAVAVVGNSAPVAADDTYDVNEDGTLSTPPDWLDVSWAARRKLTFDNTGQAATLTTFPVLVSLDATRIDYGRVQDGGEDLRFTDPDGTVLDYEIEKWDETGTSQVWVKVTQIDGSSGADFIWMYHDNPSAAAGENAGAVWSGGYQLVHHLHDDFLDSSGFGHDGTNSGSTDAAGRVADGQSFDGINDRVDVGSASSVDDLFFGGATVSAWINPTGWGEGGFGRIFDKANDITATVGWALRVEDNGDRLMFERGFSTQFGRWRSPNLSVSLGTWQWITVAYDSSSASNDPTIYIDGNDVGAVETTSPFGAANSDAIYTLAVGNRSVASDRTFIGALDEVRIATTQRSADWVAAQYLSMTDAFVSYESAEQVVSVLANDSDANGDPLTAILISSPSNAQAFSLSPDGTFTYTPQADFEGVDTFTYKANDGTDDSGTATVTITVNPVNDAPVLSDATVALETVDANAGAPTGPVGTLVSSLVDLPGGGGLDNVTDLDAGAVTGLAVTGADTANGTWHYTINSGVDWFPLGAVAADAARLLAADPATRIYFEPDPGYGGTLTDAITFRAWDQSGGDSNGSANIDTTINGGATPFSTSADTASLTVNLGNNPPVALPDSYDVDEDGTLTLTPPPDWFDAAWGTRRKLTFDNSAQAENLAKFPVLLTLDATRIDYGRIQNAGKDLRFTDPDGTVLDYEIEKWDETGTSQVWVKVTQIDGASGADFIWMYYDNPSAPVGQGGAVWSSGYQLVSHLHDDFLDSSGFGHDGTNSGSTDSAGYVADGQDFDGSNDRIDVSPASGINDLFSGGATISAWFRPTGWGENNFGRVLDKASGTTANTGWSMQLQNSGDRLRFEHGFSFGHGTWLSPDNAISLNTWQWVTVVFDSDSSSNDPLMFIDGSPVSVNQNNGPNGSSNSDTAITLSVGNRSSATDRSFDGMIDEVRLATVERSADWIAAQYLSMTDALVTYGAPEAVDSVLSNDSAPDGDGLTAILVSSPSNAQAFSLSPNGTFTYSPQPDFDGVDTFTYKANDGAADSAPATVTITVNPVNDAPDLADSLLVMNDVDLNAGAPSGAVGTLVSTLADLVGGGGANNVTDVDSGAVTGIAIVDADDANGTWHYSLNNGVDWTPLGAVAGDLARVLAADSGTRVYFEPDGVFSGTIPTALTFRAWDRSDGSANGAGGVDTTVNGGPSAFSTATDTAALTVNSVNAPPSIALTNTTTTLPEDTNTTGAVKVADIEITDDGIGTNLVTLGGADAGLFEVSGADLRLKAGTSLDFESDATLDVMVLVDDVAVGTTPDDEIALSISITDVNEAPTVSLSNPTTALAEDIDTSGPIVVADIDVADDALGTESLGLSGADASLFEIAGTTLRLKAGASLDFETNPVLDVIVEVDDLAVGASPDDTAALSISISDVNEPPTISLVNTTTTLPENTNTFGPVPVADILMTDDGLGSNDLTLSGPDAALFEIVNLALRIRSGTLLDYETDATFDVTVRVNDLSVGGDPDDTVDLAISITDVNEAPTVSLAPITTTLPEDTDTTGGITAADIIVTDDALGTNGLALAGADAGLFEIDGTTLRIRPGVTFDFETNPALDVTVQVDDTLVGSSPDDSAPFTVAITNVNEAPIITGLSGDSLSYDKGSGPLVVEQGGDTAVTDVDSTDFVGGTLVVSLAGGHDLEDILSIRDQGNAAEQIGFDGASVRFGGIPIGTVTGGTGGTDLLITFTAPEATAAAAAALIRNITFEVTELIAPETGGHSVTFVLTDGTGAQSLVYDTTVNVIGDNGPPTEINLVGGAIPEATDTTGGFTAGTLSTTDPDSPEVFTYDVVGGDDAGLFSIGGPNLDALVVDDGVLDFERQSRYEVTIRVTDGGGNLYSEAITISVADVNDQPTLAATNVTVSIPEDIDTSSAIKVADITIADDGLGSNTLTLDGDDAGQFELVSGNLLIIAGAEGGVSGVPNLPNVPNPVDAVNMDLRIVAGAVIDFESNPVLDVFVLIDDPTVGGSPDDEIAISIRVGGVNDPP